MAPVLALAIAAISSAAVLVRMAPDVHPVAAAFWRTAAVALLLSPGIRRVSRRDAAWVLLAGLCLAGHFWSWFASLQHTSVLRSTVLVCLNPIWAGALEGLLGERPSWRFWAGVGIAVAGVAVMSGGGGEGALTGDGLALLGGMLGALYLVIGRAVRQRVSIAAYGTLICASAAGWLLLAAAATGAPLAGFAPTSWLALAALALGPQLMGHIGMNYAVRYVPAAAVSALILLEPAGAGVLAAAFLREIPGPADVLGGLVLLGGVLLATWPAGRRGSAAGDNAATGA